MNHEVRIPDIEVLINVAGSDMAVVSFYKGKTVHDDFEIMAGISSISDLSSLVEVLQQAITTLKAGGWQSLDELDSRGISEGEGKPPF